MPIEAMAASIARDASLSDLPWAMLYEMVVAACVSWWFTEVGVDESAQLANADSGDSASDLLDTATPVEAARTGGEPGPEIAAAPAAALNAEAAVTAPVPPVPEAKARVACVTLAAGGAGAALALAATPAVAG